MLLRDIYKYYYDLIDSRHNKWILSTTARVSIFYLSRSVALPKNSPRLVPEDASVGGEFGSLTCELSELLFVC